MSCCSCRSDGVGGNDGGGTTYTVAVALGRTWAFLDRSACLVVVVEVMVMVSVEMILVLMVLVVVMVILSFRCRL